MQLLTASKPPQDTKSVAGRTAAFFERRRAEQAAAGAAAVDGGGGGSVEGAPAVATSPAAQLPRGPGASAGMSLDVIGLHYLLDRASAQSGGGTACAGGGPHQLHARPLQLALPAPGDDTRPEEAAREQEAYLRGVCYVPVPVQQAASARVAHGGVVPTAAAATRRADTLDQFLGAAGDGDLHMGGMLGGSSAAKEPLLSFPRMRVAEMIAPPHMAAPAWAAAQPQPQREQPAVDRVPVLVDAAALDDEAMMCTPPDAPRWPPDPAAEAEKALDASVEALIQEGEQAPVKAPPAGDGQAAVLPMQPQVAAFQEAAALRRQQVRISEEYTHGTGRRDAGDARPRSARDLLSLYVSDSDDDMGDRLGSGPSSPCALLGVVQLHGMPPGAAAEEFSPPGSPSAMTAEEAHAMVTTLTALFSGEHVGPAPALDGIAGRTSSCELLSAEPAAVDAATGISPPPPDVDAHDGGDTTRAAANPADVGPGQQRPAAEAAAAQSPAVETAPQAQAATPERVSRKQTRGQRMVELAERAVQSGQDASAAVDSGCEVVGMLESYALQLRVVCACLTSEAAA